MAKKIKSHFQSHPQTAWVRFPHGMGSVCAEELRQLIATLSTPAKFPPELFVSDRSIRIEKASLRTLAELCLKTRCARDLLWQLIEAPVLYEPELVELLKSQPWSKILPIGAEINLRVVSKSSRLYHTGMIKEKTAEVLTTLGYLVSDNDSALTTLELRLARDLLSLSISLAGETLGHRGYRKILRHNAPLNECLTACCLQYSWDFASSVNPALSSTPRQVYLPFAGSGTMGFEAALMFGKYPPSAFRKSYAVELLELDLAKTAAHIRNKASESKLESPIVVSFVDNEESLIEPLQANSEYFLEHLADPCLQFTATPGDFFSFEPELTGPSAVFINPPYGNRLETEQRYFSDLALRLKELAHKNKAPLWGCVLLPQGAAEQRFVKTLNTDKISSSPVKNGGLSVSCIAFVL